MQPWYFGSSFATCSTDEALFRIPFTFVILNKTYERQQPGDAAGCSQKASFSFLNGMFFQFWQPGMFCSQHEQLHHIRPHLSSLQSKRITRVHKLDSDYFWKSEKVCIPLKTRSIAEGVRLWYRPRAAWLNYFEDLIATLRKLAAAVVWHLLVERLLFSKSALPPSGRFWSLAFTWPT